MKKEIDNRLVIALVAVLVLIVGFFGWRMFAPRPEGSTLSPQEAGLGKPLYPAGGTGETQGNTQTGP